MNIQYMNHKTYQKNNTTQRPPGIFGPTSYSSAKITGGQANEHVILTGQADGSVKLFVSWQPGQSGGES